MAPRAIIRGEQALRQGKGAHRLDGAGEIESKLLIGMFHRSEEFQNQKSSKAGSLAALFVQSTILTGKRHSTFNA